MSCVQHAWFTRDASPRLRSDLVYAGHLHIGVHQKHLRHSLSAAVYSEAMKHLQSQDSRLDELDVLFVPKMNPHFKDRRVHPFNPVDATYRSLTFPRTS